MSVIPGGCTKILQPLDVFINRSNSRNIFLENMMTGFIKAFLNIPLEVKGNSSQKNVSLK